MIFVFLAAFSLSAFADSQEFLKIRNLLPVGWDVASVKKSERNGVTDLNTLAEIASRSFIYQDITKDGLKDILVIAEENPECSDKACESLQYKDRSLMFFEGKKDGSFEKKFENKGYILRADGGGMMGDPLQKLEVKGNGSIIIEFFGGGVARWTRKDTIAYRDGELRVIGQDSNDYTSALGDLDSTSVNLITGKVIRRKSKSGTSPIKTTITKIKSAPLRLATYKGQ